MTRDEYLQILRDNLTTMTDDEKDDVIRYYLEYFSDSGDEWAAMEELGAPEKLAARLCSGNGAQNSENTVQGIIQVHRIRQRHMAVIMMAAQEPMIIHGKKETPKGKNHPEK